MLTKYVRWFQHLHNVFIEAVNLRNIQLLPIRDLEDTVLFYIALTLLHTLSLIDGYAMCRPLTSVLFSIFTVLIEVYLFVL